MIAHHTDLCVVGLGYVGLPLAREALLQGLSVIGLDASFSVVEGLRSGRSHVDDLSDLDIEAMLASGFVATSDQSALADAGTVIICVPTPLSHDGGPDLAAVRSAATATARYLRSGQLVVLESTTYPGTTEEVLVPLLEESGLRAGVDFHVAFSPERIDPGNAVFGIRNTPKVVGGLTPACTERAVAFYSQVVDVVVPAIGVREAEMTKLLENTYRHINIALVNEMACFCHELDIDLWDSIRCASTKPFGFEAFYPGPGVGGHCIPIDPNYLSHRVKSLLGRPFRFVELAQEVNASMPSYVVRRAQDMLNERSKPVRGSRVTLLGVTYKANIADQRESPAMDVAEVLLSLGAEVSYHDPFVEDWCVNGHSVSRLPALREALLEADIVILLQSHRDYEANILESSGALILDTRGYLHGDNVRVL